MAEPSSYELDAWRSVERFAGRPLSRAVGKASGGAVNAAAKLAKTTSRFVEEHPKLGAGADRVRVVVGDGAGALVKGARKAGERVPDGVKDWSGAASSAARQTVGRVSRAGLSSKRIVKIHKKRGHDVGRLSDLRRLDLELIDDVGLRGAGWYYPALAAASGAGAGLVISGGELVVTVSGGVAAAPSASVLAGTFAADTAAVLGLASRAVGHVSLLYGYDPEEPSEKLFVMSVINAGTAASATAKTLAFADVSRLTQALVRGQTWKVLDKSVISVVSKQFAGRFGARFTKQSLGKIVPAAGIALGGAFNWATLESIFDAANIAYRRRFLLEKYPQLEAQSAPSTAGSTVPDADDETISLLDDVRDAGGPEI